MSHGSLTDAVNASGSTRWTALWIDSTPGKQWSIDHGHVAWELVMICSPAPAVVPRVVEDAVVAGVGGPVMIDVWFASVTVGSPAIAPCP